MSARVWALHPRPHWCIRNGRAGFWSGVELFSNPFPGSDLPCSIQSVTESNGEVTLTWDAIPGQSYRVQYKSDLNESVWNDLSGDVVAAGESASKTDASGLVEQRFYRILVLP